jgi:hypothetical protein
MLADRLLGRPAQAITGAGGGPLEVSFGEMLARIEHPKSWAFVEPQEPVALPAAT